MLRTGAIHNAQRHLETLAGPSFQRYFATRPRRDESRSSRGPGGSEKSSAPRYNRTYSAKDNKETSHRRPRDDDRSNSRFPPRNADASSTRGTSSWGSGRRGRDSEDSGSRYDRRPSSDDSRPTPSSYPPRPKWNDRATSSRSSPKDRDSDTSSNPPRSRDSRGKPRQLSRWEADDEKLEQSKIPRYLRREAAHIAQDMDFSSPPPPQTDSRASGSQSRYRSRHLTEESRVPIRNPSGKIVLLEPHVLSARLKKSCEAGHIEEAVSMLKRSPLDAQNPPVWNTLIWECLKAKRFKLAYQLYIDMKRRGFSPTTRTFQTMFSGLSRIEFWSSHPKQLAHAHSLYDSFKRHLDSLKKDDPESPDLTVTPLTSYIKILGATGAHQEIFDIYYEMDSEGPLAPNQFIFAAMFQALSEAKASAGDRGIITQSSADAKLLWTQMLKASQKKPGFQVDSYITAAAISALARGRPADQQLAFKIVHEYLGLTLPGEPPSECRHPITAQGLYSALRLCNISRKHPFAIWYYKQMMRRSEHLGGVEVLHRGHMEEVMKAYIAMAASGAREEAYQALQTLHWMLKQELTGKNGPNIRPATSTFNLVMMACWRGADWESAARTFELMTGYKADDFKNEKHAQAPRYQKRSTGRNLIPDAETMSSMVRAVLASDDLSHDREDLKQCLRIVDHVGADLLFGPLGTEQSTKKRIPAMPDGMNGAEGPSKKALKHMAFYHGKLASALLDLIDRVQPSARNREPQGGEAAQWAALRERAKKVAESPASKLASTPASEHLFDEPDFELLDADDDVDQVPAPSQRRSTSPRAFIDEYEGEEVPYKPKQKRDKRIVL